MSSDRCVVLAYAFSPDKFGGMEAFAKELAIQLKRVGWSLSIWFQDEAPPFVRANLTSPGNVTLEVLEDQQALTFSSNLRFLRLLRKHRPSTFMYSIGGVVRLWPLIARLSGVRRIIYWDQTSRTRDAMNSVGSSRVAWLMKPLTRSMCATRFIKACSDREKIVPPSKSGVIYSGTDTRRQHGDGRDFRHSFNIPDGRLIVLQVSWLVPDKGIDVALRAAQIVLRERDDLQFVFCGDGEFRAKYEALAQELGIADHVTWTGQVQDLVGMGAFAAADIQIQCSQWQEAFCFAVAEGMSAGLPIVASRIGGLPELVSHGENGFLFEPPSPDQLAAAILQLAEDQQARAAMGHVSRQRATSLFDLEARVAEWVEILTSSGNSTAGRTSTTKV